MREKKEIPEMVAELGNDSREVRITAVKELSARMRYGRLSWP
jgi:hypothetical protein